MDTSETLLTAERLRQLLYGAEYAAPRSESLSMPAAELLELLTRLTAAEKRVAELLRERETSDAQFARLQQDGSRWLRRLNELLTRATQLQQEQQGLRVRFPEQGWKPEPVDLKTLGEVLDSWQEDNLSPDDGFEPSAEASMEFLALLGQMGFSIVSTSSLPEEPSQQRPNYIPCGQCGSCHAGEPCARLS